MLVVYTAAEAEVTPESLDNLDKFNHPRRRRELILEALNKSRSRSPIAFSTVGCSPNEDILESVYAGVHDAGLLQFLRTAWNRWEALGQQGRDPSGFLDSSAPVPPFAPINSPLPRDSHQPQRSSKHVMGQLGYYCTDTVTPIHSGLLKELQTDAFILQSVLQHIRHKSDNKTQAYYLLLANPGHHSARCSFGGYCYVNHAAALAKTLGQSIGRTAVLDVDYHAGNGTTSIFYDDPNVFVVSIHCDPDYEYPFHSGFADETGTRDGIGATLNLPLPPGTTWENGYRAALEQALDTIASWGVGAMVISLGLDTHLGDPCAIRRAAFALQGDDYVSMGQLMADRISLNVPTIFVQEGGYRMDVIGEVAANVVTSFAERRSSLQSST